MQQCLEQQKGGALSTGGRHTSGGDKDSLSSELEGGADADEYVC